jgi:mono/diheme cytochrome c family protein
VSDHARRKTPAGSAPRNPMRAAARAATAAVLTALAVAGAQGRAGVAVAQQGPDPRQAAQQGDRNAAEQATGGSVYQGWKMFHVYCYRCHGTDAIHNPSMPGPDLRDSVKSLAPEQYHQTVKEGRLPKGMPAWGQLLTEKQVKDVYAYLLARSNGSLKPGRPDEQ